MFLDDVKDGEYQGKPRLPVQLQTVENPALRAKLQLDAAVGGMMVPSFTMPEFMQAIGKISPHYWALSGYQDVLVRGLGTSDVLNEVAVLCGFAGVFFIIALWRFRFQD